MHLTTFEQCARVLKVAKGSPLSVSLIWGSTHDREYYPISQRRKPRLTEVEGLGPNPIERKQLSEQFCLDPMIKFTVLPIPSPGLHGEGVARLCAATLQNHPGLWNQGCLFGEIPPRTCLLTTLQEHCYIKLRFTVCSNLENELITTKRVNYSEISPPPPFKYTSLK